MYNVCDFLFAFLHTKHMSEDTQEMPQSQITAFQRPFRKAHIQKKSLHLKNRIWRLCPFRVDLFSGGRQNKFERVAPTPSPKGVSIPLKGLHKTKDIHNDAHQRTVLRSHIQNEIFYLYICRYFHHSMDLGLGCNVIKCIVSKVKHRSSVLQIIKLKYVLLYRIWKRRCSINYNMATICTSSLAWLQRFQSQHVLVVSFFTTPGNTCCVVQSNISPYFTSL